LIGVCEGGKRDKRIQQRKKNQRKKKLRREYLRKISAQEGGEDSGPRELGLKM